ncbi:hypothetical protein FOMPIDRAFT_1016013 [Fomitopsis schrenkii]|uniref:Uncharacterized protein n=1 Tax=Fomitopsis schrenkii TaxID=2126942 RepID=S8E8G2_FOMSC|nr:hypothetical protein FOMPIDRAFT_1016013 [Fomitopsis schrenkii]
MASKQGGEHDHWRMKLNNTIQANRALGAVNWEVTPAPGTQHQGPWTAVVTTGRQQLAASSMVGAVAAVKALRRKLPLAKPTKKLLRGSVEIECLSTLALGVVQAASEPAAKWALSAGIRVEWTRRGAVSKLRSPSLTAYASPPSLMRRARHVGADSEYGRRDRLPKQTLREWREEGLLCGLPGGLDGFTEPCKNARMTWEAIA